MEHNTLHDVPRGGTEILFEGLRRHIPQELLQCVSISTTIPQNAAHHLKPFILWEHQSYDQPNVQALKDEFICDAVDGFVFVSQWQKEQYLKHFPIPNEKAIVIHNAIEQMSALIKQQEPLRLIYTSTPFRGLDVLLDAFALLNRNDVELHVYSGMSLYGSARANEDSRFEALYEKARHKKGVSYHGVVSNEEIRKALQEAHIFAYPNTWEETSCLSLIEALSAGCLAVVPELGALPETASGYAQLYPYPADKEKHAVRFIQELSYAIDHFWDVSVQQKLKGQQDFFTANYSWDTRKEEWEIFLNKAIQTYGKNI